MPLYFFYNMPMPESPQTQPSCPRLCGLFAYAHHSGLSSGLGYFPVLGSFRKTPVIASPFSLLEVSHSLFCHACLPQGNLSPLFWGHPNARVFNRTSPPLRKPPLRDSLGIAAAQQALAHRRDWGQQLKSKTSNIHKTVRYSNHQQNAFKCIFRPLHLLAYGVPIQ